MGLTPLHRRKEFRLTLVLALAGATYLILLARLSGSGQQFFRYFLVHLALAFAAFVALVALVAQFVLPVRQTDERRYVIGRLLNYLLGERGPVVFIRVGRAQQSPRDRDRRGPGVILLDQTSAAVLRTDVQFTRTVGPGKVALTELGERVAESLDLRRQRRTLRGSIPSVGGAAESTAVSALAITRDGIPVSATIQVTFMLARRSPIGRGAIIDPPPYDVAEGSLQWAVFGKVVGESQDLRWDDLPLRLVVDLWREQAKERSLDDLGSDLAVREQIESAILSQLTRRDTQPSGGRPAQPSSASRVLEDRGIRILDVRIPTIFIPEPVRQERLRAWFESWSGPVQRELAEAETMEREARRRGSAESAALLARSLTRKLSQGLKWHEPLSQRDSLILIFEDALEISSREPRLAPVNASLREALDQIKSRDSDCRPRRMDADEP